MSDQAKIFMQQETSERSRREYRLGADQLGNWLEASEALLSIKVDCNLQAVRTHVKALDVSHWLHYIDTKHYSLFTPSPHLAEGVL